MYTDNPRSSDYGFFVQLKGRRFFKCDGILFQMKFILSDGYLHVLDPVSGEKLGSYSIYEVEDVYVEMVVQ